MDNIDYIVSRFPEAFNERQQTVCGVWTEFGPCVCGKKEGHDARPDRDSI